MMNNNGNPDQPPMESDSSSSDSTCSCPNNNRDLSLRSVCSTCNHSSKGYPTIPDSPNRKRSLPDGSVDSSKNLSRLLSNLDAQITFVEEAFNKNNEKDTLQEIQNLLNMLNITPSSKRSSIRNLVQDLYIAADINYFSSNLLIRSTKDKIIYAIKALHEKNCLPHTLSSEPLPESQRYVSDEGIQSDSSEATGTTSVFEANNFNISRLPPSDKVQLVFNLLPHY